jgi:hypothetical protein
MCKGYTAQYDKHHNSKRTSKNIADDTNDNINNKLDATITVY